VLGQQHFQRLWCPLGQQPRLGNTDHLRGYVSCHRRRQVRPRSEERLEASLIRKRPGDRPRRRRYPKLGRGNHARPAPGMRAVRLPAKQRPGHERPNCRSRAVVGGATPEPVASGKRIRQAHRGPVRKDNGSKTRPVPVEVPAAGVRLRRSMRSIADRAHVLQPRIQAEASPEWR